MDSYQIRLFALGRDVQVGNLYNYYSDSISICNVRVPQESISINKNLSRETQWFYVPQPIDYKYEALGINAHLRASIKKKSAELSQLWFGDFLESSQVKEDKNVAQVTFFFRVCRRIESLHPKFLDSNLNEYQLQSDGVSTHLVEQVVYGAEFICSMERTIDRQHETKENAEGNLYLAAEDYFNQVFGRNSSSPDLPAALDKVKCQILSSLEPGNELVGSFQQSFQYLMDAMSFDDDSHWRPIKITLRNIPEQMEARLRLERENDVKFRRNMHEIRFNHISNESGTLNVAYLEMFPQFQSVICQFCYLLEQLRQKIQRFHETSNTTTNPERNFEERQISHLLHDMMRWLIQRRSEIEKIFWLIKGTHLKMMDLAEIEAIAESNKPNRAKVFVLRAEFYPDPLIQSIYTFIGNPTAISSPLPVLPILSADKSQLQKIREELHKLSEEAQFNILREQEDRYSYYIGITSEYQHLADGTITTFGDYKKANDSPMKQQGTGMKQEIRSFLGPEMNPSTRFGQSIGQRDVSIKLNDTVCFATPSESSAVMNSSTEQKNNSVVTSSESSADTEVVHHQSSKSPKMNQANGLNQSDEEEGRGVEEEDTKSESLVDSIQTHCSVLDKLDENENCINKESADDDGNQSVQYWKSTTSTSHREFCHYQTVIDMDSTTETPPPDDIENDQLNNQSIAEFFVDEKNRCAKLIKKGQPNIYLLNATDTSASEELRWFDVGRPVRSPPTCGVKNHKVIILMGATGCGKSTLINGMVNYILGVKWNDPFRFKCVREDETTARNQAISQTSSVTAYTIRHRDGMAVPYSITIIDTPGYGDTRGVQRDKEITRNIQQFLTQQGSRVEEIHAACFVAASGDSRLTTTQKYIIDSTLSIFGKDIQENIRLLVTFADNADPPVVEACRFANFPVTSASAGIIYSKFNSSVLYSSNEQQEEDLCFDELFWDMGQENFSKFFSMLEGMNGRNLESTREVIQRRTLLEESLKHIEQELEVCLFNIENIEKFQRKMKECGRMMESSKDFAIESMKMCYSRVPCENGFYAYNCRSCQKTCESPIHAANPTKLPKHQKFCSHIACVHSSSEHDYENVQICSTQKKTKKTLLDMKAQFESNSNEKMTNERLLADCSDNLNTAKAKVFSLLDQVGENVRSLESTALRSNTLSPADYLSLMRSRVAEEQKPGYQIRLETLSELQQSLADDEAAKSQQKEWFYPIQTSQFGIRGSSRGSRRRGVLRRPSLTRSNK